MDGVIATAPWSSNFKISWDVEQSGNIFNYKYTISGIDNNLSRDVSYLVLQVSDNFTKGDIFNIKNAVLADGPKFFKEIGGLMGIKFEDIVNPSNLIIEFDSYRSPMWGSFYTKDGKFKGVDVKAFNSGLEFNTGSFIAVPDTTVVPNTNTIILMIAGLFFISVIGLRKCTN